MDRRKRSKDVLSSELHSKPLELNSPWESERLLKSPFRLIEGERLFEYVSNNSNGHLLKAASEGYNS